MSSPLRVLIVEDSEDDCLLLTHTLRRAGYDLAFERVERPEAMNEALDTTNWHLVLADYSMPNFGGDVALAMLRKRALDIPFIFVSGTIGEEAAVAAMRVGANDYIMKGNLSRLVPAIERELHEVEVRRQQRNAELALKESNLRYRELVENATYGIYCSEMEVRLLEANPAMAKILGYDNKQELLSLNLKEDVYRNEEHYLRVVREAKENGSVNGLDVEWRRRDGSRILVRLSGRVLSSNLIPETRLEMIAEDVTEHRTLEKQVAVLQKFDAIGRLAGGIAHDFNNVIGAILGWADLGLQDAHANSSLRRYFEQIRDNSQMAANLTRQLLAFSRKQSLDPVPVDLSQMASQFIELLSRTIGPSIKITNHLRPGLAAVLADPSQIQQVLMNLCLNARDAMPQGGELLLETAEAEVSAEYARTYTYAKPGGYVLLTVADTGIGMDATTLENIFEPFFTTKEAGKGTGLGLATVYGIVRQHGGFVQVSSERGSGTVFRVYWPEAQGKAKDITPMPELPSSGGGETLLFADDHEGIRAYATEVLGNMGYTVLVACDGEEAWKLFQEHNREIALLVLDVTMPKLTGPEVYKRVSSSYPGVPVLFLTGYSREMTLLRSFVDEGHPMLQKPFSQQDLGRQLRLLLDSRKSSNSIERAG
ncbi:MAG: response regulator [Candidatus Korobacteraceae bacterium]